eukprot:snap_masked-scaffold_9-processed-gene-5.40-mRNA-1 protein AED:1.00 eAED:1.00 QI:0/-1/0/0/-1/1/1/0/472
MNSNNVESLTENLPSSSATNEEEASLLLQLSRPLTTTGKILKKSTEIAYSKHWNLFKDFCDDKGLVYSVTSFKKFALEKKKEGVPSGRLINYLTGVKNMAKNLGIPIPKEDWKGMHTYLRQLRTDHAIEPIVEKKENKISLFNKRHLVNYYTRRIKTDDFAGLQKKVSVILTLRGQLGIEENKKILKRNVVVLENDNGGREILVTPHASEFSDSPKLFLIQDGTEVDLVCNYLSQIAGHSYEYLYVAYNAKEKKFKNMIRNTEFFNRIPREVALLNNLTDIDRFTNESMHLARATQLAVGRNYTKNKRIVLFGRQKYTGQAADHGESLAAPFEKFQAKRTRYMQYSNESNADLESIDNEEHAVITPAVSKNRNSSADGDVQGFSHGFAQPHRNPTVGMQPQIDSFQHRFSYANLQSQHPQSFQETNSADVQVPTKGKVSRMDTPWGPVSFSGSITNLRINGTVHNYFYKAKE